MSDNKDYLDGEGALHLSRTCIRCVHLISISRRCCRAFPSADGIPPDIWMDRMPHNQSIDGDNGIQFTPTHS
ncbi:MAG: hypothetical protein RPU13_07550 [Candidatus Sedimenticola sp. (ex Thyasira tokunagai)]